MGLPGALIAGSLGKGKFNWGRALSWGLGGALGGAIYEKRQGDKHRAAAAASALEDQSTPQIPSATEDEMSTAKRMYGISQTPQGVLSTASTARSSLLGN